MDSIAGYARTGRIQLGPGSDLVEVQSPDGGRLTAIQFHAEHRGHNAINSALTVVLGFLESPMVSGLTDLCSHDRDEGAFVYATGQTWSVAEVIRTLGDLGECAGVRAGIELMHAAGQILIEAAETGEAAGVYSHGGLTPWRVMLSAEGGVQVVGHALPQVEILTFHEDPNRIPREDAFRYCPPERMESRKENFSSDLFGLALIAFELMTGKPVYDGLVNDIRAKAARGETSRRIHQFRELLPDSVREMLTTALRPDIRDRFTSGADFVDAVDTCLRDPYVQGASLRDVMQRASRMQPRTRQELDPARTSMLSKEELRRLAEQEEAPAPKPARTTVSVPATRPPPSRAPETPPPALTSSSAALTSSSAALSASSARVGLPQRRAPPRLAGEAEDLGGATSLSAPQPAPSNRRWSNTATMEAVEDDAPARPPEPPVEPAARPPVDAGRPPMGAARLPPSRRPPASMTMTVDEMDDPGTAEDEAPQLPPVPASRPPVSRVAPPPPPPSPRMSTEALLARVRSSGSSERGSAGSPPPSEVIEKILHSSGNRQMHAVSMPAVVPGPAKPASVAPTPPPPAPPVRTVEPAAPPSAPPSRPPDPIKSSARGEPVAVRLGRAPGLHGARRRLPGQTTLGEAVHLLIGQVVPLRTFPDGRLAGWYRIGPDSGPLPPDRKLESLDDETNHVFHPVDNAVIVMEVEAPGIALQLPVGTAVPVVSLIDSISRMLGLPGGEWVLHLDGEALDPFHILADHPPGRKLSLKKA